MKKDKRSVVTDALETLGNIIDDTCKRDAIHLAVEPCIAGEVLSPGDHIGVLTNNLALKNTPASYETDITYVGIVDPFLKGNVQPGQKFWLILYPRTITSLRHVWEHPNFPENTQEHIEKLIKVDTIKVDEKEKSIKWMQVWANRHMSEDYYDTTDEGILTHEMAYANAIEAGKDNHVGPYEDARDHIDDEWWDHWERITGLKGDRGDYFSCSC